MSKVMSLWCVTIVVSFQTRKRARESWIQDDLRGLHGWPFHLPETERRVERIGGWNPGQQRRNGEEDGRAVPHSGGGLHSRHDQLQHPFHGGNVPLDPPTNDPAEEGRHHQHRIDPQCHTDARIHHLCGHKGLNLSSSLLALLQNNEEMLMIVHRPSRTSFPGTWQPRWGRSTWPSRWFIPAWSRATWRGNSGSSLRSCLSSRTLLWMGRCEP